MKRRKKEYTINAKTIVGFIVRDEKTGSEFYDYLSEGTAEPILEPHAAVKEILGRFGAEMGDNREHFGALYLDTRRKLIGAEIISTGTLDSSLVHPREVFTHAVRLAASAVVVFHNHPSGDPEPSAEDMALTRRLDQAARLLGFSLLDHLVIAPARGFVSLRERQRNGRTPIDIFAT